MSGTEGPTPPGQVNLSLDNTVCVIYGRRGKGKTTLAYELARRHKRVILYDSRWQMPIDLAEGWKVGHVLEDVAHLLRPFPNRFRFCYRPIHPRFDFPWLCKMLDTIAFPEMRETLFVVDEILKVADRHTLPPWWNELIHFSRHGKIGLVITTQRPTDVHGDVQAEASDILCFKQHHPADIKRLSDVVGPAAAHIATLPDYHALWWHDGEVNFPIDNRTLEVVPCPQV